jgi:hypothetical protein
MPDNAVYYHAAYVVAAVLYGGYVVSLALRGRDAPPQTAGNGKRETGNGTAGNGKRESGNE